MVKNVMIEHGAPTLAGIKTGNIFTVRNGDGDINREIRMLNGVLTKKGLRLIPIRKNENNTLVYVFRPDRLQEDLTLPEATEILEDKGYPCGNVNCCIAYLVKRLMSENDFPHEIGLFLGYPPSDVKGFMENPSEGVKCSGCWKAYSNECEAKRLFETYKKCARVYQKQFRNGKPLESLVVDTRRFQVAI